MQEPGLRLLFEARGQVSAPRVIGQVRGARRQVIAIEPDGPFVGDRICGRMVSGFDWQWVRADGVTEVDAAYLLETDDGVLIECRNTGIRHAPPEVMARMGRGEAVDPSEYYFRATPVFTAPEGKYDWLNRALFLSTGARYPDGVRLRFYEIT
ncbi:DUF3237 domain-containing protein [Roseinatronobacter sp. S2]|uniref:DUF3237 domain-containing protein n=1 Tax=Roseinatronobacter sp. S2 TaxID=3035471 RepID=UPI00240FBAD7|nr:DUF3237 domain-containing protein [Roseinatronobacter sp. S2]WFE76626.1 DUF3237 domain-containing protein [Roseinatronobacter sp. S2]